MDHNEHQGQTSWRNYVTEKTQTLDLTSKREQFIFYSNSKRKEAMT